MDNVVLKPGSFHLQWHITERCNLKCKHCYFDERLLDEELSREQLLQVFKQYLDLAKEWGLSRDNNRISVTGGEPLLRKDLFWLLGKFKEHGDKLRYSLMTNATTIDKKTAEKIRLAGVSGVQVSLEGIGKANDEIRGRGSFARAEKGIRALLDEDIKIAISMTVTMNNLGEIPSLIEFCLENSIDFLGVRRLIPIGRGEEMRKKMLEPQQVKNLCRFVLRKNQELAENGKKLRIMLGCEDGLLAQDTDYEPQGCTAGYYSFSLLPNGDIYPCRRLPILLGNALKEGFWNTYYKSDEIKKLRQPEKSSPLCKCCPSWSKCRGGAKCISYGYFGTAFAPDPQCWGLFKNLPSEKSEALI